MRRQGNKLTNINFGYLRKAIEEEGYSVREVSEVIGFSESHLNRCLREKYIYEDDLAKIKELVPLDDKRLTTIPREEDKAVEKPKTVSMDEAVKIAEKMRDGQDEQTVDINKELADIKHMLEMVLLALERGGFIKKSYDEIARDVLRRMLDSGRCKKEDYISELAKCGVRPPGTHCENAIKDLGVIEARSVEGRNTYTWLIRE